MEKEFLNISLNKVKSKPGFSNIPNNLHIIMSSVAYEGQVLRFTYIWQPATFSKVKNCQKLF